MVVASSIFGSSKIEMAGHHLFDLPKNIKMSGHNFFLFWALPWQDATKEYQINLLN